MNHLVLAGVLSFFDRILVQVLAPTRRWSPHIRDLDASLPAKTWFDEMVKSRLRSKFEWFDRDVLLASERLQFCGLCGLNNLCHTYYCPTWPFQLQRYQCVLDELQS